MAVGRGRAVVFSVLIGEQRKETLTVLLRDSPAGRGGVGARGEGQWEGRGHRLMQVIVEVVHR